MLKKLLMLCLAAIVLLAGLWQLARQPDYQLFGTLVPRVDTAEKLVALTFDDGPTPFGTDRVLALLDEHAVPATFFLNGRAMAQHPGLAHRIVESGHQIANHSWSHSRMVFRSPAFMRSELDRTDALIRGAGFQGEIVFRPPYGKKLFVLPWVLRERDTTTVTWDVDPETGLGPDVTSETLVERVRNEVRPGSIILLHVMFRSREASMAAVPELIETLEADGYRFVTVNDLIAMSPGNQALGN